MAFVNIFVESQCNICVEENRLILRNTEREAVYPIEDINCVMLDCLSNNVSLYTLEKLSENGATVILCDEKHLPFSSIMPLNKYYKKLSVLSKQLEISKPKIKTLWQSIITKKIINQAHCLMVNNRDGYEILVEIAKNVTSGDSENAEARAAVIYFKKLFGDAFSREADVPYNGFLNYTYSIVRSLVCRHLSARGFECSIGIFHKNQLNAFNLADDIIEPFRPIVDNFVFNLCKNENILYPQLKKKLFGIVNLEVISGNEKHSFSNAIERIVESLLAYYNGNADKLIMPSICDLSQHQYE